MPLYARLAASLWTALRTLHWRRGLRAGFAVATAMVVCRMLGRPMGWAALGGFEAVLVDNGGPYRSRMNTIAAVLLGGALCGVIGTVVPTQIIVAALVTAAVCFLVTFARVASQPIASTSVIILVLYFAGYGSSDRTLHAALANVAAYILGGLWAAVISLFLWPVDPFRPARLEVAGCYNLLATFTASLHATSPIQTNAAHDDDHTHSVDFKRQLRTKLESARAALSATPARAPARTIRARNLSVLLESADMLFAATIRLSELAEVMAHSAGPNRFADIAQWLSGAERAIADVLRSQPADNAASFADEGSHRTEFVTRRAALLAAPASSAPTQSQPDALLPYLLADERDALQNIEIAFEAVRAVWTGVELRPGSGTTLPANLTQPTDPTSPPEWLDAIRDNWNLDSIMMRHALRMAAVGAADVLLMRAVHVNHGFWLAMTSIIVLQPYGAGTLRKGLQRVGGTIGGGILAALLAAFIHSYSGVILVITACSILALATYAVDYGWYSFFLTPAFVLMSLPYLRDWRYAGVRIVTTMLGALTAVVAMHLLWPQSLTLELSRLLGRSASAVADYLRALLLFWKAAPGTPPARIAAERRILAPARRTCGLTSQDAEEALDRILLDPVPTRLSLPLPAGASDFPIQLRTQPAAETQIQAQIEVESALTFTTYIRRFTQCLTTLASTGSPTPATIERINRLIGRLDTVATRLNQQSSAAPDIEPTRTSALALDSAISFGEAAAASQPSTAHFDPSTTLAEQMLQRMERQTGVLERAASTIARRSAVDTTASLDTSSFAASS